MPPPPTLCTHNAALSTIKLYLFLVVLPNYTIVNNVTTSQRISFLSNFARYRLRVRDISVTHYPPVRGLSQGQQTSTYLSNLYMLSAIGMQTIPYINVCQYSSRKFSMRMFCSKSSVATLELVSLSWSLYDYVTDYVTGYD